MKTIRQLASFLLQSKDKISWHLTVKQVFDIDLRCVYMFFLIKNMTKITRRGIIEDKFYLKNKIAEILNSGEKQKSRWQNAQHLISRWQNMSQWKIWQAAQYKISNAFRKVISGKAKFYFLPKGYELVVIDFTKNEKGPICLFVLLSWHILN